MLYCNYQDSQRDILIHENLLHTTRLVRLRGFAHNKPGLTRQVELMAAAYPTLFTSLVIDDLGIDEAREDRLSTSVVRDVNQPHFLVLTRLANRHYQDMLSLPTSTTLADGQMRAPV